jgi:ankyrin repeat protein
MLTLRHNDSLAVAVSTAIRQGDVQSLERSLDEHPELVSARIQDEKGASRTLLHIATDWPGHFPNGSAVVRVLIQSGADPNAPMVGSRHTETALHWAASCDDVEVIDTLLNEGANLEATGACIAGGTPLDNAVAFGQFTAARRLVERGAQTKLWQAAALGLLPRVQAYFSATACPRPKEVTEAFWQACHGGQRATAEFLLERGADINGVPPWSGETPLDIALVENPGRPAAPELVQWLRSLGAKTASELRQNRAASGS